MRHRRLSAETVAWLDPKNRAERNYPAPRSLALALPVEEHRVILEGILGSTAYGLATPQSDEDRLGVFLAPTTEVLGLDPLKESHVGHGPDRTLHEFGKFVRLATKANPTVLELLWLPSYTVETDIGRRLLAHRQAFLSDAVKDTYGGYAMRQLRRLQGRGDGSFSADTRKRTAKHARHCVRLILQGSELRRTGRLRIALTDSERDRVFEAGEQAVHDLNGFARMVEDAMARFDAIRSVLSESPDVDKINDLLVEVRIGNL